MDIPYDADKYAHVREELTRRLGGITAFTSAEWCDGMDQAAAV
jgi:hypothetical protein